MRVLPGFDPDGKIKLLHRLRDQAEIIICVYAGDIEQNKVRSDLGITYDQDVLRLMDDLHYWDLKINSVLITRYTGQPAATQFKNSLERRELKCIRTATQKAIQWTLRPSLVTQDMAQMNLSKQLAHLSCRTALVPTAGKLATCLSQLYQGNQTWSSCRLF